MTQGHRLRRSPYSLEVLLNLVPLISPSSGNTEVPNDTSPSQIKEDKSDNANLLVTFDRACCIPRGVLPSSHHGNLDRRMHLLTVVVLKSGSGSVRGKRCASNF